MHLNIVVIFMYFVARVMLSLLLMIFIMYVAIVKRVVPIAVNALNKSPLLLLLLNPPS